MFVFELFLFMLRRSFQTSASGWCPGPDEGSRAETPEKLVGNTTVVSVHMCTFLLRPFRFDPFPSDGFETLADSGLTRHCGGTHKVYRYQSAGHEAVSLMRVCFGECSKHKRPSHPDRVTNGGSLLCNDASS